MLPIFAADIVWAEVPIVTWLFVGIVIMLVTVWRFGRSEAQRRFSRHRVLWGVSLAAAVPIATGLHIVSGQPLPRYL